MNDVLELKAKAKEMQLAGKEIPNHMKLPDLQEILKMRPAPTPSPTGPGDDKRDGEGTHIENNITTFMFVAEHLVGAVLGKKGWDKYKCRSQISAKFTPSDEAYLYVILSNSYELWVNAEGSRVGSGNLTKDGTNKKYCGWTQEGIKKYNDLMHKVKENRRAAGARDVEQAVMDALKEWYNHETRRHTLAVCRRRKRRRQRDQDDSDHDEHGLGDIDADNDLSEVFATSVPV
jgi:hypothetical protein